MTDDRQDSLAFSFSAFAEGFDDHIRKSIRGYEDLVSDCIRISEYFIEDHTTVLDIGCSAGTFLRHLREQNKDRVPHARYVGVEIEDSFASHWTEPEIEWVISDIRNYSMPSSCSMITSLFSFQFIAEKERQGLLERTHKSLVPGGALVLAEKTLSRCAKLQDMLTFIHYDYKRRYFSEAEILEKEKSLRSIMKLWTEDQIVQSFHKAGFREDQIQCFWRSHSFAAFLALKT
jgi:tRNA (cmo5U34)-methyltransferase